MYLTQKQTIKPNNSLFKELDHLCYLSKNLYNSTLYVARKSFFDKKYRNYYSINKEFTDNKHPDYVALPAKVAKQTQLLVDKSFKSYFSLVKKKKAGNYNKPIMLPRYLDLYTLKMRYLLKEMVILISLKLIYLLKVI